MERQGAPGSRIVRTAAEWTHALRKPEDPDTAMPDVPDGRILRQARVRMRIATGETPLRRAGEYLGAVERMGEYRAGTLTLTNDRIEFDDGSDSVVWLLDEITAVQPSSASLQIKPRGRPVVSFRFPVDSPRLWETLISNALNALYQAAGRGEIVEFQPRIVTRANHVAAPAVREPPPRQPSPVAQHARDGSGDGAAADATTMPAHTSTLPRPRVYPCPRTAMPFTTSHGYRTLQRVMVTLWRTLAGLTVTGLDNVPESGPFILVANHQSILDPILLQAVCPRTLNTMAKSTQFAAPILGAVMAHLHSFPVRRYQIDPQSVRVALRRLSQGQGVCIYPEGERSWDGELQPFRLGTLRLILKAGVPLVPCGIRGSYEAWPRWDRRPALRPVRIAFGEPLAFPELHTRAERERALEQTDAKIRSAIAALL